ncbi:hypothetical protein MycrhDRAFT_5789 [Mycolicibacterium rhodesiae JS60]|nr:hypothetical protein MycrhDRAFT_5789 [Mycolicibacterium rhodesiae JS60]
MRNWLGQEIQIGSWVGRNANEGGDTKIGRVFAIEGRVIRVHWLYSFSYRWSPDHSPRKISGRHNGQPAGGGPIDVDRLFLLDPTTFGFDPQDWWKED